MGTSNVALGVVIGGAVGATFGKSLSDSSAKIDAFKQKAETARGFHNMIGDTIRLRGEMGKLSDKSGQTFSTLLRAHEANIAKLRQHGFAVDALDKDYVRLGRTMKGLELSASGRLKIGAGIEKGQEALRMGAAVSAAVAVPTMISANYQSIIRKTAIKGGFAGTKQEEEMSERISTSAGKTGISRNELAVAIDQLVSGGMDAKEAVDYADLIGKFSVGQDTAPEETAKMIRALSANAKITDSATMAQALESIAYLGKAGNFESQNMAKAFPGLLAEMGKLQIFGQDAVTQLGAMLQVQMKVSGSADEAANNLKNWFSKIGSSETVKNYGDAGIDYEKSMTSSIANGVSPLEASFGLAKRYIEAIDPKKAASLNQFAEAMSKVDDAAKREAQIKAFEETLKTGDLFNDMQVKAALTAYMQNSDLYKKLKKESAKANGELDKDLAHAREASKQKWLEVGQAADVALGRIGDAIRPLTDGLAVGLKAVADGIAYVSKEAPILAQGIFVLGAAFAAVKIGATVGAAAWKLGGGMVDVARGAVLARGASKIPGLSTVAGGKGKGAASKVMDVLGAATGAGAQPVFVTNWPGGGFDIPGKSTGKSGPLSPKDKLGRATHIGRATTVAEAAGGAAAAGKTGMIARIGTAITGVAGAGRTVLAAPTLGAAVASGAGSVAMAGGAVLAAGAAGYGIGTLISAGIDKAISAATGKETSLGSWLYDKLNPEPPTPTAAGAGRPADAGKAGAAAPVTFAPSLAITVQGDVKDPRDLAQTLMPDLRRLFDQMQAQNARTMLHDAPHV